MEEEDIYESSESELESTSPSSSMEDEEEFDFEEADPEEADSDTLNEVENRFYHRPYPDNFTQIDKEEEDNWRLRQIMSRRKKIEEHRRGDWDQIRRSMEEKLFRNRSAYKVHAIRPQPTLGTTRLSTDSVCCPPSRRTRSIRRFGNWSQNFYHKKRHQYAMSTIDTVESHIYKLKRRPFEGDDVYRGILYTVTHLRDITLYNFQLDFIKTILPPLFKYIYRNEWKEQSGEILRRHNYKSVYDEVFFRAERRMGKTLTLSFFCLSVVANVTKERQRAFKVAVFAVTEPNAKMFIDECENNWKQLPNSIRGQFHFVRTSIRITLTRKSDISDVRIIQAYIGNGPVSNALNVV